MRKLKQNIDYGRFFTALNACQGDVYFDTINNDHLNLKSTLSQFVFSCALSQCRELLDGFIVCTVEDDYKRLQNFLEGEISI